MKTFYSSRLNRLKAIVRIWHKQPGQVRRRILGAYLKRFLFWRIRPEPGQSDLFGQRFVFPNRREAAFLFTEIFIEGMYLFESRVESPVILDVGANIGMASIYFKLLYPDARITAIEAVPTTASYLKINLGNYKNVSIVQAAANDKAGEVKFFTQSQGEGSGRNSSFPAACHSHVVLVPGIRLSSVIDGTIDLLKLDIEGGELAVLRELAESGKLLQIRQIIMEYHYGVLGQSGIEEIKRILHEADFRMSQKSSGGNAEDRTVIIHAKKGQSQN